jgi:PAS domain S-box-containing protein
MTGQGGGQPGPVRVLVIEHDPDDAELCLLALEQGGISVEGEVVTTPEQLAESLQLSSWDLVLCDYRMPGWSGLDALRLLRALGMDTPLILVTGTLGEERAVECLKEGVADYVLKQNLARLPVAVRRALEERRAWRERVRADDLIRKLSLAVDQSPASVVITDTVGRIEYVNRRFVQVTGHTEEEALGRTPRLLKSGETPERVYRDLWRTIREGRVWQGELRNRRKSGDLYWDAVTISPLRNGDGAVTHFVATQQDITERKRIQEEIAERDQRFRQLADNIQEVFFLIDADLNETLYLNPAYERIWGRSCESAYRDPRSFLEAIPPEDRERLLANIARLRQDGISERIEFRVVRPDGQVSWLLGNAVAVRDQGGRIYRISGVALDITERRRAEEALQESAARLRKLIEASFDGIAITQDGVVLEANQGLADMFGYALDEMIGRPVADLLAEESREFALERMKQEIEGPSELVGRRKDGGRIQLEVFAKTHQIQGRPARVTALRDVTERRSLEEQFRQAQKMEAVGRLAGGVAHDFNNLLTVITSYAELVRDSLPGDDPLGEDLGHILTAASDAASLTRQLLAFSRQQVIEPRLVVIEEEVARAAKMLGRLLGEDIELITVLSRAPLTIKIDPGQLNQIIMNLAVNARDAMPAGGKVTIETNGVEFTEEYVRAHPPAVAGRFAMLAVSDTGLGMDAATRARIFEPFFTTKEVGKGTGLGLATVYGIVKQNAGFIWVYSEPERGATFKIYLPLSEEPAVAGLPAPAGGIPAGTETVLVVEDAPSLLAAIRQILTRYGYRVLEATSGKSAMRYATDRALAIDLLLTDVVMPDMNGRELARAFAGSRPGTKVLFMSGYTSDAVLRQGVLERGMAYLEKPFTPEALARRVRDLLDASS